MDNKWKTLLWAGVALALALSVIALGASGGVYQMMGVSHYTSDIEMVSADIYLEGNELYLDTDDDTNITADTDDQVDIAISGADDFRFTANTFTALSGSTIAANTVAETTSGNGVVVDGLRIRDTGIASNVIFTGTTILSGTVLISSTTTISGATIFSGTVLVSDTLRAEAVVDANLGLTVDGGVTNIGGGSPDVAAGDNDLYVTNDLEVDGELRLDGTVDVNATMTGLADLEHLFFPTVVISDVAWTSATGSSGAVATIGDGEIWFVWAVFVNVTTDFDCTGDDSTLIVGDGADTDGFVVLADAELQTADTEQTGSPAGWQGLVAATMGVYLDCAVSSAPHIYAPSGAAETIDFLISEASGDTLTAGEATIYVIYTRIQ